MISDNVTKVDTRENVKKIRVSSSSHPSPSVQDVSIIKEEIETETETAIDIQHEETVYQIEPSSFLDISPKTEENDTNEQSNDETISFEEEEYNLLSDEEGSKSVNDDHPITQDQIDEANNLLEEIHLLGPYSFVSKYSNDNNSSNNNNNDDNNNDLDKENPVKGKKNLDASEIMLKLGFSMPENINCPSVSETSKWSFLQKFLSQFIYRRRRLSCASSLENVIELVRSSRKIIILTGAGISVSCGIPDFRSKNGLYSQIQKRYSLPSPECMFDIEYFKVDPLPFFSFIKELFPEKYEPSVSHKFIAFLDQQGQLLRNFTQNIDTLEAKSNIQNVIYCHGSFSTSSCLTCKRSYSFDELKVKIEKDHIPRCDDCLSKNDNGNDDDECRKSSKEIESDDDNDNKDEILGIIKPDIVFFGESLPSTFHKNIEKDVHEADLLLVIGSSLSVYPVASIPDLLPPHIPQILINKEPLGKFNFDVELIGECDVIIEVLREKLGYPSFLPSASLTPISKNSSLESEDYDYQFMAPNRYVFNGANLVVSDDDSDNDSDNDGSTENENESENEWSEKSLGKDKDHDECSSFISISDDCRLDMDGSR